MNNVLLQPAEKALERVRELVFEQEKIDLELRVWVMKVTEFYAVHKIGEVVKETYGQKFLKIETITARYEKVHNAVSIYYYGAKLKQDGTKSVFRGHVWQTVKL
jgi:hypothetical protein